MLTSAPLSVRVVRPSRISVTFEQTDTMSSTWCEPRHMVPRYVEVAPELPRTSSFKVMKAQLRAAGVTSATWDRVAAGLELTREQLD